MTARSLEIVEVPPGMRHTVLEDAFGLLSGTFVVSLGIYLLTSAHAVTGGTAGLALLLSYGTGWPFGVLFFAVNLSVLEGGLDAPQR